MLLFLLPLTLSWDMTWCCSVVPLSLTSIWDATLCCIPLCFIVGHSIMLRPFMPCCGMQLMLHPFMYYSGTRHDVVIPLHLVPRAWGAMRHDVAVPLLLTSIWDATGCLGSRDTV
jgi:hypothetical protein